MTPPAIWSALCILDEAADQARRAPVEISTELEHAWVFLMNYSHTQPALTDFMRTIQLPDAAGYSRTEAVYQRGTMACTLLNRIARGFGVERQEPSVCDAMRALWQSPDAKKPAAAEATAGPSASPDVSR